MSEASDTEVECVEEKNFHCTTESVDSRFLLNENEDPPDEAEPRSDPPMPTNNTTSETISGF
jgi:hypothetical protein